MNDNHNIEYPPPDEFFISNPRLQIVNLSNNSISDLAPVLNWLRNTKSHLKKLSFYYNINIQAIPDEINLFTELIKLDLRTNSIRSVPSETFRGLTKLVDLNLRNNEITDSPRDAFRHNSNLETLSLENNKFSQIHDLPKMLNSLRYSNQNGYLTELRDYQFDFEISKTSLYVNLDGNNLVKFGNKTFCSQINSSNSIPIKKFTIDFSSLTYMHLCLFRQMGIRNENSKYSTLFQVFNAPVGGDLSEFCNCNFIIFLDKYNTEFSMPNCELSAETCIESSNINMFVDYAYQKDDECAAMEEFDCFRLPTTLSTTPQLDPTTTKPENFAHSSKQFSFKIIIVCLFLSFFDFSLTKFI